MKDYDQTLRIVGKFGRYQKSLLILIFIPVLIGTCHSFIQVFAAGKSDHWCQSWQHENCNELNITNMECNKLKREVSVPAKVTDQNQTVFEQCVKYDTSAIDLKTALDLDGNINTSQQISCDEGWVYDRSNFPSTIIIDFELVCEKSFLPNMAQSAYFVGFLCGSAVVGLASDILGRRTTLLICLLMTLAVGIATTFTPTIWFYIVCRFLIGVPIMGIALVCFVYANELVSPSRRTFVGNALWIFYATGYAILAGLAKLIPNWRLLHLVISLPYIPTIILVCIFVPESPRWLLVKGKIDNAQKVLRKVARINRKKLPENFLLDFEDAEKEQKPKEAKGTLSDFVRSPLLLFMTIIMCFNWAVQSLVYYGLSLSTSTLGIDPYISFLVSGAIEIPAYLLCMYLAEWLGRKGATFSTMIIGGLCCCATPFIPLGISRATVAMVGKFCITISFSVVYTWSAELVPTPLRTSGMGLFSLSSRIGGISTPIVLLLDEIWKELPTIVLGSFSIIASLLCLLLPETKGRPLPSTAGDIKHFYRKSNDLKTLEQQVD